MQFNQTDSNTEVYGEVLSNKVGIDINNIDFIINILSTNLYSSSIESFLRETVSNAWDSHVEAGVKDAVVIEIGEEQNGYYCAIRDNGVGLSEERFNKIYRNIGSSTKRDTNEQIGGFGIGRFSALAYSNMVHITSIYNNIKYLYVMYKDGNSLSIDLISKVPTEEHNGVEVKVLVPSSDIDDFIYAIKNQLCFFENLILINLTNIRRLINFEEDFNNLKIKKYKTFSVKDNFNLTYSNDLPILIGKVCYYVNPNSINFAYTDIEELVDGKIHINFDIGELDVTPNRESVNFTKKSIKAIQDKIDLVMKELDSIIDEYSTKEFKHINEIKDYNIKEVPLIESDDLGNKPHIDIPISASLNFTYKGVLYDGRVLIHLISRIEQYHEFELYSYILSSSNSVIKSKSSKRIVPVSKIVFDKEKNVTYPKLYNANYQNLNTYARRYIGHIFEKERTEKVASYFHLITSSQIKKEKIKIIRYMYYNFLYCFSTQYKKEYRLILNYVLDNLFKDLDNEINNYSVPLEFIEEVKEENKKRRLENKILKSEKEKNNEEITVYNVRYSFKGGDVTTDLEHINLNRNSRKLVIYDERNSDKLRELFSILSVYTKSNYKFIEVANSNLEKLKVLKNFVCMEDLIKGNYKLIKKIATIELIHRNLPHLKQLSYIRNLDRISPKLAEVVNILDDYSEVLLFGSARNAALKEEIYNLCVEKNYFDENIRALLKSNLKMLKSSSFLLHLNVENYKDLTEESIQVAVDYILAKKLFLPNPESLKHRTKNKEDLYTLKY
jgi:hypothetical protein